MRRLQRTRHVPWKFLLDFCANPRRIRVSRGDTLSTGLRLCNSLRLSMQTVPDDTRASPLPGCRHVCEPCAHLPPANLRLCRLDCPDFECSRPTQAGSVPAAATEPKRHKPSCRPTGASESHYATHRYAKGSLTPPTRIDIPRHAPEPHRQAVELRNYTTARHRTLGNRTNQRLPNAHNHPTIHYLYEAPHKVFINFHPCSEGFRQSPRLMSRKLHGFAAIHHLSRARYRAKTSNCVTNEL